MKKLSFAFVFAIFIFGCEQAKLNSGGWIDLFDGESLAGWRIIGGAADIYIEDGMIVCNSILGYPNTYLCTEKFYKDFVLEFDVKIDEGINSGMQIRSRVWEKETETNYLSGKGERKPRVWKAGSVWGYQIEVDSTDRAWTAGLYEPGNRGWLVILADNEAARTAFKKGDWNSIKVRAQGNHIQTWISGVLAVDTTDDKSASGFFGLQIYGIHSEDQVGRKVRWRNIRMKEL